MTLTTRSAASLVAGGAHQEEKAMVPKEKEEKKENYEVVSGFCIGEGENVWPGQVIALTSTEARRHGEFIQPTDKPVGPPRKEPHRKDPVRNQSAGTTANRDPK